MRDAERLNWSATRGVHEELLFENMPDDLQRDIRRHLFAFLKKVNIRVHFLQLWLSFLLSLALLKMLMAFAGEDIFEDG